MIILLYLAASKYIMLEIGVNWRRAMKFDHPQNQAQLHAVIRIW